MCHTKLLYIQSSIGQNHGMNALTLDLHFASQKRLAHSKTYSKGDLGKSV